MGNYKECHSTVDLIHNDDFKQQLMPEIRVCGVLLRGTLADDDFQRYLLIHFPSRTPQLQKHIMLFCDHRWFLPWSRSGIADGYVLIDWNVFRNRRLNRSLNVFNIHEENFATRAR